MATRQNQNAESTTDSTEQANLFNSFGSEPTTPNENPESTPSTQQSVNPEGWDAPFIANDNASLETLTDPPALVDSRELATTHGDDKTAQRLKRALRVPTVRDAITNVRELLGIHAELNGTHMFNENLAATARKVLERLRQAL